MVPCKMNTIEIERFVIHDFSLEKWSVTAHTMTIKLKFTSINLHVCMGVSNLNESQQMDKKEKKIKKKKKHETTLCMQCRHHYHITSTFHAPLFPFSVSKQMKREV